MWGFRNGRAPLLELQLDSIIRPLDMGIDPSRNEPVHLSPALSFSRGTFTWLRVLFGALTCINGLFYGISILPCFLIPH